MLALDLPENRKPKVGQSENYSALQKSDNEFFVCSEVETKRGGIARTPAKH